MIHEIKKLSETIRDYEGRLSDINRKILEVKSFINEMSEENLHLKEKLKNYEQENTGIGNDLDQKENRIDNLERTFAEKHEQIKNQVENYIELEHQNEKNLKETKHKLNLVKIENEKYSELNNIISNSSFIQKRSRKPSTTAAKILHKLAQKATKFAVSTPTL
jgi:chromosome segregation ATPase